MDFAASHRYDCDVVTLHATLTDADYLRAKFTAIGFHDVRIVSATPTHVETSRVLQAPLPGFARRVLGDTQTIVQVEDWTPTDDHVDGRFHGGARGQPAKMSGTLRIDPDGTGARYTMRGTVEVTIPFVGSKIAGLIVGQTEKHLDREWAFTEQWLAEHPRS